MHLGSNNGLRSLATWLNEMMLLYLQMTMAMRVLVEAGLNQRL